MRRQLIARFMALCVTSGALSAYAVPTDSAPVQSKWRPQEIRYSYIGHTTAYNCDAAEDRLKDILLALGAHPQTQVRASGCFFNRPSTNFFITITTATPVAATDNIPPAIGKSEQELIDRLGAKGAKKNIKNIADEQFPAVWKTVDLSRDRKLNLQPGDCELMDGLRDEVLPKLGVKIVADRVQCMPHQVGIQTPELKVTALVRVAEADRMKPATMKPAT